MYPSINNATEYELTHSKSIGFVIQDPEVIVSLYLQFKTLWFLMLLDRSLESPKEVKLPSFFVFASDQTVLTWQPDRSSGFFKPGQYLVIVPKSHVLLEAFMLLYAQDPGKRIGVSAMPMIGYIEEYVDEDGLLKTEQLSEPLLTFYKGPREKESRSVNGQRNLKRLLGYLRIPERRQKLLLE